MFKDDIRRRLAEINAMPEPEGDEYTRLQILAERNAEVDTLISRWNTEDFDDDEDGLIFRSYTVEGIHVARGGSGRVVEAYAAVFDQPQEIKDQHGHYMEVIHRSAFNKAISRGTSGVGLYYNHGSDLSGKPNGLLSVPIGSPMEIRADGKGLLTVSRFNKSALADSVLEAIRAGDIKGYSFKGRILRSEPATRGRSYGGSLQTVVRHELGLSEYGPTPNPYYADAAIVAVRGAYSR